MTRLTKSDDPTKRDRDTNLRDRDQNKAPASPTGAPPQFTAGADDKSEVSTSFAPRRTPSRSHSPVPLTSASWHHHDSQQQHPDSLHRRSSQLTARANSMARINPNKNEPQKVDVAQLVALTSFASRVGTPPSSELATETTVERPSPTHTVPLAPQQHPDSLYRRSQQIANSLAPTSATQTLPQTTPVLLLNFGRGGPTCPV